MSVFDPTKQAIATVKKNALGALSGALIGYYALQRFKPSSKIWIKITVVTLSAVIGAGVQNKVRSKIGSLKSNKEARN